MTAQNWYLFLGRHTGAFYAQGTEEDCWKYLQQKYPGPKGKGRGTSGGHPYSRESLYPEPLRKYRVVIRT